ncbi:MAG: ferritin-like domain-containing protein [Acidobacteriota bacterium]|nr:ferritin-like domain-containing protein [Acidobacteriota bacterium]
MKEPEVKLKKPSSRRSFLKRGMLGAGGAALGAGLLAKGLPALADDDDRDRDDSRQDHDDRLTDGDAAILRLLAAAETVETDLWLQYSELGGVQDSEISGVDGGNPLYAGALQILDADMPQYVHDNTDDELTHAAFLNAYLQSKGRKPVDLKRFSILPSSKARGARQIPRLTNLTQLTVDTSFWTRYRSTTNPDLGAKFAEAVPSLNVGQHTAIPRSDADTAGSSLSGNVSNNSSTITTHLQAIAFTAGFHFAFIEQAGTSLYHTLTQKVSSLEVLRILVSIGGSEIMHFQTWQDKAGNALPLTDIDPITGASVTFADLTTGQPETLQANLIMPEPCQFINKSLPECAIIRPTGPGQIDAVGAISGLIDDGLFFGQTKEFTDFLLHLAREADAARREV